MDNSNSDDIVSLPEDSLTEDVKTSKDKQRSAEKIRHHEQKVRIYEPEDNLVRESKPANSNYLEPWVQFEDNTRDETSSSGITFWNNVFVASKILMCVLIFMLILSAAVVSKICFIIITANIYPTYDKGPIDNLKTMNGIIKYYTKETNVLWIWALILMAGTPYVFTAVKCLWRVAFVGTKLGGKGRLGRLPYTAIIVRLLFETINSVGLNMMIFIVIPKLDPVSGLLMTNCIGLVPALLKVFYPTDRPKVQTSSSGKWSERSAAVLIISILGVSGQIAAIGLWVYHVYYTLNGAIYSSTYIISLILAPIFTSAHWWENFVYESKRKQGLTQANRDKTTKTSNEMNQAETRKETITLSGLPRIMRKYRYQLSLYASIWRIILTFVMPTAVYGLYCQHHHASCVDIVFFKVDTAALNSSIGHIEFVTSYAFGSCSDYLPIIIAAVGALSSGICYKLGKIACKIMTQVVDFSLPLVLSTPATLGLVFGMYSGFISTTDKGCAIPFPTLTNSQENYFLSWYMDSKNHWLPISAGLCGFISLLLVTNYIWSPGKERLQTTEKLFVLPLYCGIFIDQSLMLNRRRIEQSYKQKKKARKIAVANKVEDGNNSGSTSEAEIPMIYLCATMWHENEQEMTQLLKSILRFDMYQYDHNIAKHVFEREVPNFFKFEAHIFFDDAFEPHSNVKNDFQVNKHVMLLIGTVFKSASEMYGNNYKIPDPTMISTPYGGRLVWKLPGMNMLTAHLKNNQLIRHRKRWSQVMYMFYFLGFEMKQGDTKHLDRKIENTFLLALDGDVDFQPRAVQLLVDRMKKNPDVGAACARIHPIGNGAMVWYQKFEYAVSHWLQKAAEDKFGCVLCSPGCFSLFRASSLMDEKVLKKYTTPPSEPRHYVQYDQGEDRWLCTLLLQQGHRVEYCAASDALTYVPEGFNEFFNQRRRWTPSTMANILDLLSDWKNVTKINEDITLSYIFYQGLLMVSSILTPGTIFLMILGAINLAYPAVHLWLALLINAVPIGILIFLCFKAKPQIQLTYAAILSAVYSLVMMIVIVGLLRQAAAYGMCSITTMFIVFVAVVFVLAALLHPQEFWCIIHGFLYFLAIPSMSMILMIYSLGNLHVVSWGTRENKTTAELKSEQKGKEEGLCSYLLHRCCPWVARPFQILLEDSNDRQKSLNPLDDAKQTIDRMETTFTRSKKQNREKEDTEMSVDTDKEQHGEQGLQWMDDINTCKIDSHKLNCKPGKISEQENKFWTELIERHLQPLQSNAEKEAATLKELIELRNKVCLIFILINLLFIIIVFSLQQVVEDGGSLSIQLPCATTEDSHQKIEPISVAFTLVFGILLFVQFVCMLMHRMSTFVHILATTTIPNVSGKLMKMLARHRFRQHDTQDAESGSSEEEIQNLSIEKMFALINLLSKHQDKDIVSIASSSSFKHPNDSDVDDDADYSKIRRTKTWIHKTRQGNQYQSRTLVENLKEALRSSSDKKRKDGTESTDSEKGVVVRTGLSAHTLLYMKENHRIKKNIEHIIQRIKKDDALKNAGIFAKGIENVNNLGTAIKIPGLAKQLAEFSISNSTKNSSETTDEEQAKTMTDDMFASDHGVKL